MSKKIVSIILLTILFLPVYAQYGINEIKKNLDTNNIRADECFLASDELEGREITERGQKVAALYIKTQFEKNGLKPINGSYYQKIKVLKIYPPKNPELIINSDSIISAKLFEEFYPSSEGRIIPEISGEVVFAGYGITAPDFNYDDYRDIDVKGKIVLILAQFPEDSKLSKFNKTKFAEYRSSKYKVQNALEHGAIGVLIMNEINRPFDLLIKSLGRMLSKPVYRLQEKDSKESIPFAYISKKLSDIILKKSGLKTDAIKDSIDNNYKSLSFEIPNTTIKLKHGIERNIEETENVVGLLEGSDKKLKDEYIIVSGHYDHEGIINGNIYNGADDNASGTTCVLNIAKILSKLKPKRSILFIAFTGEEKGLFGSTYYAKNPLIDFNKTMAAINIDMVGRKDEKYENSDTTLYIYAIGPKIMGGNFPSILESAKKINNMYIDYEFDTLNDMNMFYSRSDHYAFAKQGIPSVFFFNGEHKDYHKPTDKTDKIIFGLLYKRVEMISYFTLLLANSNETIKIERPIP